MLLRGGSPGTMPSNKQRWTHAAAKLDLVFLIHLTCRVSAPHHQPFNFLVGRAFECPRETAVLRRVALFVAMRSVRTLRGSSKGQKSWLELRCVAH